MTHYLRKYANFHNKFELDAAVTKHRNANWQLMNDTDRAVLDIIRQYSVKYGAAHLKHATIEEATGKSNSTVRRVLRKLRQLQIIDCIHFIRPVMNGLGANIYTVLPFTNTRKQQMTLELEPTEEAAYTSLSTEERCEKAIIATPEQPTTSSVLIASPTLFERMKKLLLSTIGCAKEARKFFGIYRQLTIPLLKFDLYKQEQAVFEQLALQALQITMQATKRKNIRHLPGYYYGVLQQTIDHNFFQDVFQLFDVSFEPVGKEL